MMNYHVPIRISTAAALGILLLTAGCTRKEAAEAETIAPIRTAPVQRAPLRRIIRARAILHPVDQASVVSKLNAPIREFYVNRGDHVRKGQLIALLENRDLAAAAVETKSMVELAEASYRSTTATALPEDIAKTQAEVQSTQEMLHAARNLYESRQDLFKQGALPRRLVDEANVAYVQARNQHEVAVKHLEGLEQIGKDTGIKQAQAQLDAAKGRHQGAEVQMDYSRIISPLNGVIADRPLYAGEMAAAGSPLLTVMDISRIVARANVPAEQLAYLQVGNPATITWSDSSREVHGKVTVVSPALEASSTTAEVWVEAPNPEERFRPGYSVQVSILAETIQDAIVIPLAALLPAQEGSPTVMVVGSDSLAHLKKIQTGFREEDLVQVLTGLEQGEQVIVVGGLGLEDKAKVHIDKSEEKIDQPDGKS